jgi:DNA adenine methylase
VTLTISSADRVPLRPLLSPLRYPGGKGALYPRLRAIVRGNGLSDGTYVEPYAGGAGAALALLITGEVNKIVINDLDPSVFAFWQAVVSFPSEFSSLVKSATLTVDEWHRQKQVYAACDLDNLLEVGFATFYLNRTNRSGVLNGGPIGGLKQTGNYKIDARFNRAALLERIRLIGLHGKKITVLNCDGVKAIQRYAKRKNTLIYADPPYFDKAGSLYMNSFSEQDHERLAECLNGLSDRYWLLTYDNVSRASELYPDRRSETLLLNYSAHRVEKAQEVMFYSDGLSLDC